MCLKFFHTKVSFHQSQVCVVFEMIVHCLSACIFFLLFAGLLFPPLFSLLDVHVFKINPIFRLTERSCIGFVHGVSFENAVSFYFVASDILEGHFVVQVEV